MKKVAFLLFFIFICSVAFSTTILFPEFNAYTEMNSQSSMFTSYRIDLVFDTGSKFGVKVGLGFKNYNITSFTSNIVNLSSLKIYASPAENLYLGYFLGKNITLGYTELGYRGFQFHQRPNFEYIGYKDLSGSGLEIYMDLMDAQFQPHLYLYQPNDTNIVNIDTVLYLKMENYTLEGYFGINNVDVYTASQQNTLCKRFGLFVKTVYGKLDFLMGLYSPDSLLSEMPPADSFYLNITEHIVIGYFEQTLSLFSRPNNYNGYAENISNDFDFYISAGAKIDNFGAGLENSVLYSSNYELSDRMGIYVYFTMDNIIYKFGIYYNLMGNAFSSAYGGFISVIGSI